jgi:hypothetical protein
MVIAMNGGASDIEISRCRGRSDTLAYTQVNGATLPRFIGATGPQATPCIRIKLNDCYIHDVGRAISLPLWTGPHEIQRNLLHDVFSMMAELTTSSNTARPMTDLKFNYNVWRGSWETPSPHSAACAVQGSAGLSGCDFDGNIVLPVLETECGGIDLDGSGFASVTNTNCRIRGNILIGTQPVGDSRFWNPKGGCHFYFNTFLPFIRASQSDTTNFLGPRLNYSTFGDTIAGTNRAFGNIISGFSGGGGTTSGGGYGHGVHVNGVYQTVAGIVASDNMWTGHGSRYATNADGVITTWPPLTAAGAANGTSASVRLDDVFSGNNANGDFANISDIIGLVQTAAHQTAVGRKLGALSEGGGYVTFAEDHIDDPQDAVLDDEMEPA